jgi:hemoglobin
MNERVIERVAKQTLYQRIGGQTAVASLVDQFYHGVVNDPELSPFFSGVGLPKLQHMQIEFFTAALDGPINYTGRPINHVHHGLGIGRRHFQAFVEHLLKTLEDFPISEDDRYAIISRLNTYVDDIAASEMPAGG